MKFYIASCVTVSGIDNHGEVRQRIFKNKAAAKTFVERNLGLSGYADLEWQKLSGDLVCQSETARNEGRYDYGQVDVVDTDSLSNPSIVLGGI